MSDSDLFDETLAAMGVEPGDPRADQLRAATAQVSRAAEAYGRVQCPGQPGPLVFSLGADTVPPAVAVWLARLAGDMPTLRHCRHGSGFSPAVLWAGEPNRALCLPCESQREVELQAVERALPSGALLDCDFCGVPSGALRLVVVPVVSLLVRGLACRACLTPAGVPA